jgi:hypothetical protein
MAIQASALGIASLPRRRDRSTCCQRHQRRPPSPSARSHKLPEALYKEALAPLVRFHSADPNIFYVYTMANLSDGLHFILDTATSPNLKTTRKLEASPYMEPFELRKEYEDDWLQQIALGKTYVTPTFEEDDYGDFLTAHTPIYDSQGRYSGFVGVDFDLEY